MKRGFRKVADISDPETLGIVEFLLANRQIGYTLTHFLTFSRISVEQVNVCLAKTLLSAAEFDMEQRRHERRKGIQ